MEDFNKNEKQHHFNQIKGILAEINEGERFCNITMNVGHENPRQVNLIIKKDYFKNTIQDHKVGHKVSVRFYLTSRKKEGRWHSMANVLTITKDGE